MASRMRVTASACLVASGLFIGGAGGAIALADPGYGHEKQDDRQGNESIGENIRDGLGNRDKNSEPRRNPGAQWSTGRPGEKEPPKGEEPEKPEQPKPDDPRDPPDPKDPCPEPTEPTEPSEPPGKPPPPPESIGGGGGGGAIEQLPRFKPPSVPEMQLPGELTPTQPGGPAVLDAGAGAAAGAAPVGVGAPIALPAIVAPPIGRPGFGGGAGPGGASAGGPPAAPRGVTAQPPAGRVPPPANVGSNAASPNASYRIGYSEYLRTAGLPQVAALAVPGLVGIMVLTGAGGLLGYRQAKAGHAVHVGGAARFIR